MSENGYNWELDYEVGDCRLMETDGRWKEVTAIDEKTGNRAWNHIVIVDVPLDSLLREYEKLVLELSEKEVELCTVKEEHNRKEFEILTTFDFKKAYGKDNDKVRKGHIHNELLKSEKLIDDLELSIGWIKNYIPLLKEIIRCKQNEE